MQQASLDDAMVFASVVDAGGFSAAARRLAMPKSTVSKRVAMLEHAFGVRLLNRTTRTLSLTEAGIRVYRHCKNAVGQMEAAMHEARMLQNEPSGTITIAAPAAVIVTSLLRPVNAFVERFPSVCATLLAANDFDEFSSGRADVMVWAAEAMPPGHAVRLITSLDIGLFASRAYAESHGLPATTRALAAHQVVAFTQSMHNDRFRWHLIRAGEQVHVTPVRPPRFASNDAMAVLAGIRAGHGIGGLPLLFVSEMAERDELVPVLPGWAPPPLELAALFRDGSSSSLAVKLFLDILVATFHASAVDPAMATVPGD